MNHREVMQQALEALEAVHPYTDSLICYASTIDEHPSNAIDGKVGKAITALRAALAEPVEDNRLLMQAYRAVQQQKEQRTEPEQEPVAWMAPDGKVSKTEGPLFYLPLYLHPPQRKPLTDEQVSDLWCEVSNTDFVTADTHVFARAIEAAHGIKQEEA